MRDISTQHKKFKKILPNMTEMTVHKLPAKKQCPTPNNYWKPKQNWDSRDGTTQRTSQLDKNKKADNKTEVINK